MLGIRTSEEQFKWSYGTVTPQVTRAEYDRCKVRMSLRVKKDLVAPGDETLGKYHYFNGRPDDDTVYYTRPFMFGSKLRIKAEGLLSPEPVITFNKTYMRFVTHRFMNVHSAAFILTDLAGLLLLHRGYAPIHCSAFQYQDATVVVAAPPNTGKTLTTMMACMDYGAKFLAEDLAITDGSTIHSVPWTSTFRYYSKVDSSWRSRLGGKLQSVFPPIELLPLRKQQPITEYVPSAGMLPSAVATHLVVLERGDEGVAPIDIGLADRKVRNLNRYEFNYVRSPLIIAHEFFNPGMDITGACQKEQAILRTLVENVDHRLVVRTPDATRYAAMIVDAISNSANQSVTSQFAA
jgi:hypothetical protein